MIFREACKNDIEQIQRVRHAVKENRLSDPSLVPDTDVEDYILNRGKGWVCVINNTIVGFSIVSITDQNVWALFIDPLFEAKGIGRRLHDLMMEWYFQQTAEDIWLSTAAGTRAEEFYKRSGWRNTGFTKSGEVKFEMSKADWLAFRSVSSFKKNFDPFPVISTGNLMLRDLRRIDAEEIFLLRSDQKVNEFINRPSAVSIQEAHDFIRRIEEGTGKKEAFYWAIVPAMQSSLAGTICLWSFDAGRGKAEIGYELLPAYHGKGIMSEALAAVIKFAFEKLLLRKLEANTHRNNIASIKLLEKAGFTRDAAAEEIMDPVEKAEGVIAYSLQRN